MNDLQIKHLQDNLRDALARVAELEHFDGEARVAELEKEVVRLKRRNVEWKCKYKKIHNKHSSRNILVTRSAKALKEIEKIKTEGFTGTVRSQLRLIAAKFFLSVGHTQDLWYKGDQYAK